MATEVRQVFISSTTRDLLQYREVAQEVINALTTTFAGRFALVPVSMDTQGQDAEPTTPLEVSQAWLRDNCDWMVLIVAWYYGYVPPGAPCSVTEAEYHQAIKSERKCFVFLPGESRDDEKFKYRALDDRVERKDLKDSREWPDYSAQQAALDKFKNHLRDDKRFDLFNNIEVFRAKLTRALTQRIVKELFQTLGPEIVKLGLQPPLRAYLDETKLLTRLKRLHDTLHRIRQFGIRSWREELMANWPDDADPPLEARIKYLEGAPEIEKLVERMRNQVIELPASVTSALPRLEAVLSYEFPKVPRCGKAQFSKSTDDFAREVQRLFTGCDSQMGQSARRLDRFYGTLAGSTGHALDRKQVAPEREGLLRGELERLIQTHARLLQVLKNHRDWQQIHDEFERIDSRIESDSAWDDESVRAERQREFWSDVAASIGSSVKELLGAAADIVTNDHRVRLDQWPGLILAVDKHRKALIDEPDISHYEAMRKHFDDLFFQIDLETLATLENAEDRVRAIEAGLEDQGGVHDAAPS